MSFSTRQFTSVLKIAFLYIKSNQELIKQIIDQYPSYLKKIEKIIEKIMYKRLSNFLYINNLIYSLQFGFQPK